MTATIRTDFARIVQDGLLPQLSTWALSALAEALERDDQRLLSNGNTTDPPPFPAALDWPLDAADPMVLAVWLGDFGGCMTVQEGTELFAELAAGCDALTDEFASTRHYTAAWDDGPREEMREQLRLECYRALERRGLTATAEAKRRAMIAT